MKGRKFKAKRGHYIKIDDVEKALKEIFGEYERKENCFLIKNYKAFKEMEVEVIKNKNKKNRMRVYTKADMDKANKALETKKDLNKFLKKITGYTAKERVSRMKDEVEE